MPNWVFNHLTIQGPKDQIDFIKDKLNSPYTRSYEDYWDVDTKKHIKKDISFSRPVFAFWNIIKPENLEAYTQTVDNTTWSVEDNWYNWNNRNWGTKWDVGVSDEEKYPETNLQEHKSEGEDQWLVYSFQTAWSPPIPVIQKLSALVPNCVVTLEYEEEQGWGGEMEFVNNEITAESNYDDKCYDCDAKDTMTYCEECENNVCSSCGFGNEENNNCETHKLEVNA